jgi:hypothetical protein
MHTDAFVAPAIVEYMARLQPKQVEAFELECVPGLQVSHEGVATMLNVPAAQPEHAFESITAEKVPAPQVRQTPSPLLLFVRSMRKPGWHGGRQNTAADTLLLRLLVENDALSVVSSVGALPASEAGIPVTVVLKCADATSAAVPDEPARSAAASLLRAPAKLLSKPQVKTRPPAVTAAKAPLVPTSSRTPPESASSPALVSAGSNPP